jgi:hypothetical protein
MEISLSSKFIPGIPNIIQAVNITSLFQPQYERHQVLSSNFQLLILTFHFLYKHQELLLDLQLKTFLWKLVHTTLTKIDFRVKNLPRMLQEFFPFSS